MQLNEILHHLESVEVRISNKALIPATVRSMPSLSPQDQLIELARIGPESGVRFHAPNSSIAKRGPILQKLGYIGLDYPEVREFMASLVYEEPLGEAF